jgi:hypothetical protein
MYRHRQIGWIILVPLGAFVFGLGCIAYRSQQVGPLLPMTLVVAALVLFSTLTVKVNDEFIEVRFGAGVIRKKWRLDDVQSCQPVRNRWWYGWGIRWIGHGKWLFNVSGLDAVELSLKDGKIYRVGTDEPRRLCELIQGKLNKRAT